MGSILDAYWPAGTASPSKSPHKGLLLSSGGLDVCQLACRKEPPDNENSILPFMTCCWGNGRAQSGSLSLA